jgi:hypothetical protein
MAGVQLTFAAAAAIRDEPAARRPLAPVGRRHVSAAAAMIKRWLTTRVFNQRSGFGPGT